MALSLPTSIPFQFGDAPAAEPTSSGAPFIDEFGNRGSLALESHEPIPTDRPDMVSALFDTYANGEPIRFVDEFGTNGTLAITSHEPIPSDRPNMTSGFAI